ncbi:MAG: hypothetical protein ACLSVX_14410 [Massilimicrobiota timonensis]
MIMNSSKILTRVLRVVLSLAMIFTLFIVPISAEEPSEGNPEAQEVISRIEDLKKLDFGSNVELSTVREPVVYTRYLYNELEDKSSITDEMEKDLVTAEAKVLNLWLRDLMPLDSFADSGMLWVVDEQYEGIKEVLGDQTSQLIPNYQYVEEFYNDKVPTIQAKKRNDYAAAMKVQDQIDNMQVLKLSDKQEFEKTKQAYENLTDDQKAYVTNYPLLKQAEINIAKWENKASPSLTPKNIIYSGARSSNYGPGTPWLSTEDWNLIASDMKDYFPNSQSTMLWIIGSLHGSGVNLEFAKPDWLTDEWLKEKDYRTLDNITFSEPTKDGHASHETYLDYFDQKGIKVYLQVESGYADMKTLMDIIMKEYGHHPCIAGFGVDVEWYWGVSEDAGLPVTDALAKEWDIHLKSLNQNYRLFLKHYNVNYLPPKYRSDIIFVNDSQSFGSMNGDALGQYDENIDDVLGFIPEFKYFADSFGDNDVIYQIGYEPDRMWYYTLDDPVVKSLGERLAEVTKQNCGIVWVDFSLKDPLTFPKLMSDTDKINSMKELIGYFRNGGSNMVGKRFAANEATYTDAMFVKRVNSLLEKMSKDELESLWASFTSENDQKALDGFNAAQAKAIDIRIAKLPDKLREKDVVTVQEIINDYNKLTDEQKAQVTLTIPDIPNFDDDEKPSTENPDKPTETNPDKSQNGSNNGQNNSDVDKDKTNSSQPSVTVSKGEVKTDDNQNIGLYVFVGLASLATIIYIRKRYFKKHL